MRAFTVSETDPPPVSVSATRDALRHARKNSNSPYDVAAVYSGQQLVGNNPNYIPDEDRDRGGGGGAGYGGPRSPYKSSLAEAWGRADPEPFEEFSAGGYVAGGAAQPSTAYPMPQYTDMEGAMSGGVVAPPARAPVEDASTFRIVILICATAD